MAQKCQKNVKEVSNIVKSPEIVCYLRTIMNSIIKYLIRNFSVFALLLALYSCSTNSNNESSEIIKVALRDVGHRLLLSNQDSTSIVKPIIAIEELKYQLSFEEKLSIHPDTLVKIITSSFEKANLPQFYLLELIECAENEVAYSYKMNQNEEDGIIPCGGRQLGKGCYLINIRFIKAPESDSDYSWLLYIFLSGVFVIIVFLYFRGKSNPITEAYTKTYTSIGRYRFYPEENKLIKEAVEINLSKKESELLSIFIAKPNQIITRDELTKKVWEDNGVYVSRSLDTYISKLRKKLQEDSSVKLSNVHGIGYKLEINS